MVNLVLLFFWLFLGQMILINLLDHDHIYGRSSVQDNQTSNTADN